MSDARSLDSCVGAALPIVAPEPVLRPDCGYDRDRPRPERYPAGAGGPRRRAGAARRPGTRCGRGPVATPLLPWLAGAADELAVRVPELAAELLGCALDTMVLSAETARALCAALATALLRLGQPEQAEHAARSALVVPAGPRAEAALRWTLASACSARQASSGHPARCRPRLKPR